MKNNKNEKHVNPPTLNGKPTTFLFRTPRQIDQSKSLAKLYRETINAAFKEQSSRTKILDEDERVVEGDTFENLFGNEPSTFCIFLTQQIERAHENDELFVAGAITASQIDPITSSDKSNSSSKPQNERSIVEDTFNTTEIPKQYIHSKIWKLMILAVHPLVQKQGSGSWLIDTAEREIKRRSLKTDSVIIVLTTVKQHAAPLYMKLGYTIQAQHHFSAGIAQSENEFTILHMYKKI